MMKKALKIGGILLLVFILFLLVAPFLFKGKIIKMVKTLANENLIAVVNFDESISLSLLKSFPNFTIGINDFSIVGVDDFEGDTLFYAKEFVATVDLKTVISGDKITLKKLYLNEPTIQILFNADGKMNVDIVPADSTDVEAQSEEESAFSLEITSFVIENGNVFYDDREMDFSLDLLGFNHELSGDFTLDNFVMKTMSSIASLTMKYEGVPFLNKINSEIKADLNMDMNAFKFEFLENKISLNDLDLHLDGFMQLNDDDIDFDLVFGADKNEFKHFISLIPALYMQDFASLKTSGKLAFDGFFKGKMTDDLMPGFGLNLTIDNGYFKYPDLPAAVEQVFVDLNVENKTGLDKDFNLNLKKFNLVMDNNPFAMSLQMKNLENPFIDGAVNGKLDLGSVGKIVPLDSMEIQGLLTADFAFKGVISKIDETAIEGVDARGNLFIKDMVYTDADFPDGVKLNAFGLQFNPRLVTLSDCNGSIGKSDFNANGQLSDFFAYAFSDGVLKGNLNFNSNYFDVNQFMQEDAATMESTVSQPDSSSSMGTIEIPTNIDFSLNAIIRSLSYDNFEIKNLRGLLSIKEGKILFKDAGMEMLGGSMVLNGLFDGQNPKMPFTDLSFSMKNFDIPGAFKQFDMIKQYAPFAEKMTGLFSMDLDIKSNFNEQMDMDYSSLSGTGALRLNNATLSGAKVMNILADQLKLEKFRKLKMKDQKLSFKIDQGRFLVDSFALPLWEQTQLKLTGYSTLDKGLQYAGFVSMPRKDLGAANTMFEGLLAQAKKKGLQVETSEVVNIALAITGDFTNPQVKLDLRETASSLAGSLKDQVKDQVREKVDDAKEQVKEKIDDAKEEARRKAQQEADRLIATAQAQADKLVAEAKTQGATIRREGANAGKAIRDEADKQAADLVAKASNPVQKLAADRAADKLKREAETKAKAVENEANKRADSLEKAAQDKANSIMNEANRKAAETMSKV